MKIKHIGEIVVKCKPKFKSVERIIAGDEISEINNNGGNRSGSKGYLDFIRHDNETYYIRDVDVPEEHKGNGVFTAMYINLVYYAFSLDNVEKITITTDVNPENTPMVKAMEKFRFKPCGTDHHRTYCINLKREEFGEYCEKIRIMNGR